MISKSNGFDLNVKLSFPGREKVTFVFISLLICLLFIYGNSLNGAWHFDDEPNIVNNKYVHLETLDGGKIHKTFYGFDQKSLSRPIAYFSFGLNYYFGNLNTFGYHVVNLIIHYFTGIFLFLFIYRTFNLPLLKTDYVSSSYGIALLATFLWAVNPVQVTAVTYIVQRMASMAGLFYIMSMYFYLVGRTDETLWKKIAFFILCAISAVLAAGTKENALMLPVSLYLYDLLLIQGITKENLIKSLKYFILPTVIVALVLLVFVIDFSSIAGDFSIRPFSMWERVLTEPRVILFYVSLLLYPTYARLMLNHDFDISRSLLDPWTTVAAILFILCCVGLAVAISKKKPLISYCIIFFLINHLIEGSFISLELVFEHRNYIPSMLFFVPVSVLIVYILDYFSYRTSLQLMIALLISFVIVAQGHTVMMYNFLFKEPYLVWSDNIAKAPNLSRPHNNIGNILWNWGLYDEAFKSYEKSFQLNRSELLPMIAAPIHNMGRYHYLKKDYAEALTHFQKAININPQYPKTWVNLALTQIKMSDLNGAEKTMRQALVNGPNNVLLHSTLSFILLKQKAYDNSIKEAWKTLALDGEATDMLRVLGEAYYRTGRYERAVFYWESHLSKYKDEIEGHLALIDLYSKSVQSEKLDRAIARVMVLKGSKSWSEMIDEYNSEGASHAYVPDKRALLSIVKKNLLKDF